MAINFLNDLDFNQNEAFHLVLENQANDTAAGTPVDGQLYYDTGNNVVKYGEGGSWVELATSSGAGTVTSITLGADSGSGTAITSSGTFTFSGGTNVTTSVSGTTVTINSTDQYVGTVTSVTLAAATGDKAGISLSGTNPITSSGTITVGVDIDGQTELATTAAGGDYVLLWDADADTNKKISVTNLVAAAPQGDITGITAGDGIAVTSGTGPVPTIAVDYTATGLIADATDGTGVTLVDADDFIFQDDGGGGVKYANLSQLKTYIDADNYNYWTIAGGTSGSSNVSTTQTVTIAGTTNQLTADESGRTVTLAFPTGGFTAPDGSIATTQSNSDNSTKLATTAYVDSMVGTVVSGLVFKGSWNASTNTPTLASGTGTPGFFYIVSVAGTTTLDGISDWEVGDWAIFTEQGATDAWEKIDNSSTLGGGGTAGQVAYWSASTTLTGDSDLTFDGTDLTTTGVVNASGGDSDEWNTAYDNSIVSAAVSGTSTKTLTLTQQDAGTVTASWTDTDTTYSAMTNSVLGLGKLRYARASTPAAESQTETASRTYGITDNSSNQLVVNVPWTDTNTTYSAGTGLSLSTTTFNCNVDGTNSVAANTSTNTASRTYKVQVDASDNLVVNVPWTDTTGAVTSVSASSTNNELGIVVDPTTGAVEVGLDITGQTAMTSGFSTSDTLLIYDSTNTTNKKVTTANLQTFGQAASFSLNTALAYITAQSGAPSGTQGWVIATDTVLGATAATDVMIEIMTSGGQTVLTEVTRSGADITVNFMGTGIAEGTYNAICVRVK